MPETPATPRYPLSLDSGIQLINRGDKATVTFRRFISDSAFDLSVARTPISSSRPVFEPKLFSRSFAPTCCRGFSLQPCPHPHPNQTTPNIYYIIMQHQLKPGLHVAIVTNPQRGFGGSLFAWETYVACRLSGIPAILATFDQHRRYPEIGADLRRLPVPDGETPGQSGIENLGCLLPLVAEAKSMGKFLIIDTRTGFCLQDPMFEVLEYCQIPEAASIAALLPIQNGIPGCGSAVTLCKDFLDIELSFSQCVFRSWATGADSRPLQALGNFPSVPLWRPNELSKKALATIHNGHSFLEYAPMPPLPDLFGHVCSVTLRPQKAPRQEIERHLHGARKAIFDAILATISQPSQ